mmetsp:Transcript_9711/g.15703  ORF Transcript_9711/g.15703 Transcript_9711/m.15703 type:complete len:88 (-) Transcript_9711:17-280(-)
MFFGAECTTLRGLVGGIRIARYHACMAEVHCAQNDALAGLSFEEASWRCTWEARSYARIVESPCHVEIQIESFVKQRTCHILSRDIF